MILRSFLCICCVFFVLHSQHSSVESYLGHMKYFLNFWRNLSAFTAFYELTWAATHSSFISSCLQFEGSHQPLAHALSLLAHFLTTSWNPQYLIFGILTPQRIVYTVTSSVTRLQLPKLLSNRESEFTPVNFCKIFSLHWCNQAMLFMSEVNCR